MLIFWFLNLLCHRFRISIGSSEKSAGFGQEIWGVVPQLQPAMRPSQTLDTLGQLPHSTQEEFGLKGFCASSPFSE